MKREGIQQDGDGWDLVWDHDDQGPFEICRLC